MGIAPRPDTLPQWGVSPLVCPGLRAPSVHFRTNVRSPLAGRVAGYSGWAEINFTDGGLPLYTERRSQLEWDNGNDQDDHLTLSNSSDHGQDVMISVDVSAKDDPGTFYIYFFYQDEDNWYRLNVDDGASSRFEKRISGTTSSAIRKSCAGLFPARIDACDAECL